MIEHLRRAVPRQSNLLRTEDKDDLISRSLSHEASNILTQFTFNHCVSPYGIGRSTSLDSRVAIFQLYHTISGFSTTERRSKAWVRNIGLSSKTTTPCPRVFLPLATAYLRGQSIIDRSNSSYSRKLGNARGDLRPYSNTRTKAGIETEWQLNGIVYIVITGVSGPPWWNFRVIEALTGRASHKLNQLEGGKCRMRFLVYQDWS